MVNSGLFTSVPFLVGAGVIVLVNWIGDTMLTAENGPSRQAPDRSCSLPRVSGGEALATPMWIYPHSSSS